MWCCIFKNIYILNTEELVKNFIRYLSDCLSSTNKPPT